MTIKILILNDDLEILGEQRTVVAWKGGRGYITPTMIRIIRSGNVRGILGRLEEMESTVHFPSAQLGFFVRAGDTFTCQWSEAAINLTAAELG